MSGCGNAHQFPFPPYRSGNSGRSPLLVVPGHLGPTGEACPALLETSIPSVINPSTPSWCVVWCHHFLDSKHILGGWGSPAFAGASTVGTVTGRGDMTTAPLGICLGWACSQRSDCCLRCVLQACAAPARFSRQTLEVSRWEYRLGSSVRCPRVMCVSRASQPHLVFPSEGTVTPFCTHGLPLQLCHHTILAAETLTTCLSMLSRSPGMISHGRVAFQGIPLPLS